MIPGKALCTLILLLYIALASGAPDEASGRVVLVTDGDTFDVEIDEHDGRIQEDTIRIRLADLDAPDSTARGPAKRASGQETTPTPGSWII